MKTINEVLDNMCNTAIEYLNDGNESHCPYELLMSFHRDVEVAVKALVADRDNWRRQALAEDARANAATCENSSQVGNAAKMREALDELLGVFDSGLVEYSDACDHSDTAKIQYVIDKAGEALSVPPRNCDRFENGTDARVAWGEYCASENLPRSATTEGAFVPWLFAESKGANNER